MCFVSLPCPQGAAGTRSCSRHVAGLAPAPWGHRHTPRVDNIQMPARPGYESARAGAQQPLWDTRSCPGGCSGSQAAPLPNSGRAGGRLRGGSGSSGSAPGTANPWPGMHFPVCTALFPRCQAWHGGTGPGPCLTLTWLLLSSRPCPAVPPCPRAQACSTGPARAFLPGEPVLERLFKGTLVPFIFLHGWAGRAPCPPVTPKGHFQAQGSSSAMNLGEFREKGGMQAPTSCSQAPGPILGTDPWERSPGHRGWQQGWGELQGPAHPKAGGATGTHCLSLLGVQPSPDHPRSPSSGRSGPGQQQAQPSLCHRHL